MKTLRFPLFFLLVLCIILGCVGACQSLLGSRQVSGGRPEPLRTEFLNQPDKIIPAQESAFFSPEKPKLCVALRGNGDKVMAHLSGLAGLVEKAGILDGAAGSSSSTISIFLYESALMNPLVWNCGKERCSEPIARSRLAFSLKTGEVVIKSFLNHPAMKSFLERQNKEGVKEANQGEEFLKYGFQPKTRGLFRRLKKRIIHRFAMRIMSEKFYQFTAMTGADLINREILGEVEEALIDLPAQKRWEILRSIDALNFNANDVSVLFREGLVDFPKLMKRVGVIGDFLAGRGRYPKQAMEALFNGKCVSQSAGKSWPEFVSTAVGQDCEKTVSSLMQAYFSYYRKAPLSPNTRLKDPIGGALKSLVPVSVIVKGGVDKVQRAFREYKILYETQQPNPAPGRFEAAFKNWKDKTAQIKFELDFDTEILYGYWGRYSDLKKIAFHWLPGDEIKSQKFTPLGTLSWEEVLLASPVEPGLSKLVPLKDTVDHRAAGVSGYMAGGWIELHPTQVLRLSGCEKIVYLTREWPEDNEYAEGLVKLFNIPEERRKAIYDIHLPSSSFNQSLREADAILCTQWGKFKLFELSAMTQDAYHAPLFSRGGNDPLFSKFNPLLQTYRPGCMPIERQ